LYVFAWRGGLSCSGGNGRPGECHLPGHSGQCRDPLCTQAGRCPQFSRQDANGRGHIPNLEFPIHAVG
jgi:hypothetical protein